MKFPLTFLHATLFGPAYGICVNSVFNPFLASGDFCRLLIAFAKSLDPDQDRQNVGPDQDPNCLTL